MKVGPGLGNLSRWDILERFGLSKLSPVPAAAVEALKGQTYAGQPLSVKGSVLPRLVPLGFQDAYDVYKDTGSVPKGLGAYGLSALGAGVQNYSLKPYLDKIKQRHDDYGKKILEGAIKTGLLPKGAKLTPQLQKALKVRTARYVNREKLGASDTRSRFVADVKFLEQRKIITPAKADFAVKWVKSEKRDYLVEKELRHLSDWYFDDLYGHALADARQKLRDKGYDLPRLP